MPHLFDVTTKANLSEFMDGSYPAKTRGTGSYCESCTYL